MTIDEEADPGDAGFTQEKIDVASIRNSIDHTTAATDDHPIVSHDVQQRRQADSDSSDSGEGNPLLAESSAPVTIHASIGKPWKMNKSENAVTVQMADENSVRRKRPDDENEPPESADTTAGPPDGGFRAWMIMIGSFTINGLIFSIINTYSLIYPELQKRLTEVGETEVSSKAALVGSLTIGTTFFLSPIAGILTDKFGIQITTFVGGAIASAGLFLSSMLTDKVELLYLTYGVMYGLGASLAYTPSLVILGHYFKKYLGLVNGIVTAGSSVFTTLLPSLMELLLRRLGLEGTLKSLAVFTAIIMACAVLFKPISLNAPQQDEAELKAKSLRSRVKEFVNVSIWKRKRYVVWACSIPLALFGYFVPYVHIGKFVVTTFKDADGKLPVMCIGITSGIGRLIFGYIADLPKVNRILLQQISFLSIGVLTMLLPVTKSFIMLLLISLGMGLFDGCFISLLGPIAFDICGHNGATQAIGFLLGMCSIPLTVGPPIAGLLYDHTGTYDLPFLLAGIPPIVGGLLMFMIRCVKQNDDGNSDESPPTDPPSKTDCQNGKLKNNYSSSVCKQECKTAVYERHRISTKNNARPLYHRGVRQQIGLRTFVERDRHKCADCREYSESVPLLQGERATQRCSSPSFLVRATQSATYLTV